MGATGASFTQLTGGEGGAGAYCAHNYHCNNKVDIASEEGGFGGESKFDIQRRVCDKCGKEVEQVNQTYGRSVFAGWLQISVSNTPSKIGVNYDFCSKVCAIEFIEGVE